MTYDYSVENLWEVVSSPNYLNNVHPFCKENSIISWNNDHHEDKILYLNDKTYIRKFVSWRALKGYDLWIGDNNKDQSFVEWRLEKVGSRSKLTITVYPFLLSSWPKVFCPRVKRCHREIEGGFAQMRSRHGICTVL